MAFGQLIACCAAIRECQDRTHCFAVLLLGKQYVRLVRWDQGGMIVSERLDLKHHAHKFAKFLWYFDNLSESERGLDPTITQAAAIHKDTAWEHFSHELKEAVGQKENLRQFVVHDSTFDEPRIYIAGAPRWNVRSALGRGTRGFFAYAVIEKRLVYLKDTWRIDADTFEREGDTYRRLRQHNVEFVPSMLSAGDAQNQSTITQNFQAHKWCFGTQGLQRHQHYRLVLNEIGSNLWGFRNIKDVCSALLDALRGMCSAS